MNELLEEIESLKAIIAGLQQQLLPPTVQPEPLEYWNAVEGWVKIDEVREHFDAVGCGTIYKTAGEDRTPLYTTPPQRPWVGLTDEEIHDCFQQGHKDKAKERRLIAKAIETTLKEKNGG